MDTSDFSIVNAQLESVDQSLRQYTLSKNNRFEANDPTKALYDAINSLRIAVHDLAKKAGNV